MEYNRGSFEGDEVYRRESFEGMDSNGVLAGISFEGNV
jgi:hypothetical protein